MTINSLIAMIMTVVLAYFLAPLFVMAYAVAVWGAIAFAIVWGAWSLVSYYRKQRLIKKQVRMYVEERIREIEARRRSSQELLSRNADQPETSR